jgi:exosortase
MAFLRAKEDLMLPKLDDTVRAVRAAPAEVRVAAVTGIALLWVYWPTFSEMVLRWHEARYSHGLLVPMFAIGYLIFCRRPWLPSPPLQPRWWGLGLVAAGVALRFVGVYLYNDWLAGVSLLPCLAGLFVLLGGGPLLRWAWPAVAFLIFMLPLPYTVEVALAHPLRRVATITTNYTLQMLGYLSFAEGNNIRMGPTANDSLDIADACSGLSMLLLFFALSTAIIMLVNPPWYEKLLIFFSAVPIAVLANVVRLTATGIVLKIWDLSAANQFHDSLIAAAIMIAVALGLLWLELRVLRWVLVPRVVRETSIVARSPAPKTAQPTASPASTEIKKDAAPLTPDKRKILPGLGLAVGPRPEPKTAAPKGVQ